ncbi:Ankyrin repeat protein 1 [Giardia duodenalis]|uniref:Ankyrin repeat protein 1 n=1 Tax=Giardia intestinalis (strain ATCC 50803 / WB clone C6) TaxID=184922 RepID=A8B9F8_GIAIC|nr:Ankyrin repeat protein 1 [Giardia intestinalis]KAE8306130.1 Ankyrin repeat protein 1 [Giardia intestinalis]|eukprot:XP_001708476.1 Hypothetical protein GL50803_114797 [Giardia lamblia ATCC 50803]
MLSMDDLDQFLQECDCALLLMSEKDASEEGAGNPTESSQTDDEGSVDEDGVTTLMEAAKRNDVKAVKRYIPYQARMVARFVTAGRVEIYDGTALMVAAVLGHTRVVKLLMRCEGGMRSSNEWTALMWAALFGRTEVVRLLLDVEGGMQKNRGFTALVLAAECDHLDCVKLLLEKERDISGVLAIHMANRWNHSEVASFLQSKGIVDPYLQMQPRKLVSELAYLLIISQCLPCFTEISLLAAVQVNPPCESPPWASGYLPPLHRLRSRIRNLRSDVAIPVGEEEGTLLCLSGVPAAPRGAP